MTLLDPDYLAATQDDKRLPEQRLWISVLLTACRDAQGINCYHKIEIEAARRWLFENTNIDREVVCDLAGISELSLLSWANHSLRFVDAENTSHDSVTGRNGAARVA